MTNIYNCQVEIFVNNLACEKPVSIIEIMLCTPTLYLYDVDRVLAVMMTFLIKSFFSLSLIKLFNYRFNNLSLDFFHLF